MTLLGRGHARHGRHIEGSSPIDEADRRIDDSVSEFLAGLPPETDPVVVAIVLIREGLRFFSSTYGFEVAGRMAEYILERVRDTAQEGGHHDQR